MFAAVSRALGQSPVDFRGAELLTGQDEGAFGWITINYILGLLVKVPQAAPGREAMGAGLWPTRPGRDSVPLSVPSTPSLESGSSPWRRRWWALSAPVRAQYSFSGEWIQPREETLVGALDMGGASTQITFVPGGPILDKTAQATFRLYGADHTVYTHSYLCFGRDQALSRLLAELVQVGLRPGAGRGAGPAGALSGPVLPQASTGLLIRHPCYHSGYRGTLALASLYESPCAPAAPPDLSQNLTVEGTGNPGACVEALRKLFNFSSCDGREDCAFAGVYQPPVQGQFYVSPPACPWDPASSRRLRVPTPGALGEPGTPGGEG